MARESKVAERIQRLLEERQRHVEAANAISETLDRINALVRGTSNGRVENLPRATAEPKVRASGNAVTLADHIQQIMQMAGKPVSIAELTSGVKAAGYKSKARNFRPVVSLALIKDKRFRRVGRGIYTTR